MNRVLIDTDILSYYFKGDVEVIKNSDRYLDHHDLLEISLITYYEITSGLMAKGALKQLSVFESFANENIVLPLTEQSVRISAQIFSSLRRSGTPLDDIDLLIAGVAIEHDLTLVTNNQNHFSRIPGLKIENWKTKAG